MSKKITEYETELKYASDEDKDDIKLESFMDDDELFALYSEGERYFGMITDPKQHACFEKDTLIKTSSGLKPIQEIMVGDMVLTHLNRYKRVAEVMKNHSNGDGFELTISGQKIKSTPNHPFLIKRGESLMWLEAENVKPGDFAVSIRNVNNVDLKHFYEKSRSERKSFKLHDFCRNKDFMWVLGRILGDGCSPNIKGRNRTQLDFGFQDWNTEIEEKIKRAIPFSWTIIKTRTTMRAVCEARELSELIKSFGHLAHGKEISPEILNMPTDMLLEFFNGYASADGHLMKNGQIKISTVSKKIAISLKELSEKVFSTPATVRVDREAGFMKIEDRLVSCKKRYTVTIRPDKSIVRKKFHEDEDFFYSEVERVSKVEISKDVFNLSVEDDNSYVADGFVVHNCGYVVSNDDLIDLIGVNFSASGDMCINLEGKYAELLGYLKLDWLTVSVVDLIDKIYKEIGIPQPDAPELYELVKDDQKTWDIYSSGATMCVNQVEKPKTTAKCMEFKPRTFEDLCAFIAAVRPGFKTFYKRFEKREDFSFGVKPIDDLIRGDYSNGSWILYQENVMQILEWAGFIPKKTYETLKGIGKKKIELIMKAKGQFLDQCKEHIMTEGLTEFEAIEKAQNIWQVIEDSAAYSL